MAVVQGVDKVGSLEKAKGTHRIRLHRSYARQDARQGLGSGISGQIQACMSLW